ncbi:recombinase XerD [Flavobacterium akiainvivens]|uniref:Recombinase XerD n=1 Tax=Flavobacterium akiainvivens TaxID=1202724 RepID=A0A0M8MHX1_9FLAO|nr:site-specific integrase [Flavobacterium akiainvivens]KOS06127.1 recombinase XerD [Flavobacterium akiainvivens]SFQ67703.1 Site-specific recombinase XerD [Flavobacterium akiainvivens]
MSKKLNFTKAALESIELPKKGQRLVLIDTKIGGLHCRVTDKGVKTFSVFRRMNGRPERVTIGKFPTVSVDVARAMAIKISNALVEGQSPADARRAHKAELTFDDLFHKYLEKHSKIKKRTAYQDESNYKAYLKDQVGKYKLSQIQQKDIADIHADICCQVKRTTAENEVLYKSASTANRILALASSIFSWGVNNGFCKFNPARGIKKSPERSRDRFLQADELPRFFSSLAQEENETLRDFFMMCLLTGARRSNVMAMEWNQISLERKEWRIPRTKNNEPQTIPLGEEAIEILKSRKVVNESTSPFVFPGTGKSGYLVEPKKGWQRILKRAGIEDLRIHDLRRTLGSWQAKTGASLLIVGKSLGHKSPQATAIYSRLDLDPVRKSMETATKAMYQASKEQQQ